MTIDELIAEFSVTDCACGDPKFFPHAPAFCQHHAELVTPENLAILVAELKRLRRSVECGCGDVRLVSDMCHICGKCQMGCCVCVMPCSCVGYDKTCPTCYPPT